MRRTELSILIIGDRKQKWITLELDIGFQFFMRRFKNGRAASRQGDPIDACGVFSQNRPIQRGRYFCAHGFNEKIER